MASVDVQILQEKANFTRLSRLLVDKATEALRSTFDTIHSPANLSAVLAANRISLLRLKPRVINNSQWDLLFPPSGNPPDSKTFDVTLLTVLFRNICGFPSTGWGVMPLDTDRSLHANIVRIKLFRNEVYAHVTSTQLDNATFQCLWQKISQALVELNVLQHDVDELKTCPLGPEEDIYVKMLKDWKLQEDECLKVLEGLSNEFKSMKVTVEEALKCSKESDEDILRKLAKHIFKGKIRCKVRFFMPGTREWLFKQVDEFVENKHKSRMLLLTAGPGFGKSVFAAKVCEDYKKKGTLAALHFCDFNNSNLRDPMVMLQSLASQMCENVEGFKDKLLDQLKRPHQVRNLKERFFWLVDVIIIYVLLTVHPRGWDILNVWREILEGAMVSSKELRARISWHVVEMEFLTEITCPASPFSVQDLPFYYLHSVFTHSPEGCFSDKEKKIAELLSSKIPKFVEFNCYDVKIMPLATWHNSSLKEIIAVGISHEKTMAAIASTDGRISVLSVPSLVELWSYPTEYKRISCCVFAPDDSLVLFGKLKTALSTVERKVIPFLHGINESFVWCAFSPNGNRLVTCDGSYIVKLWDVSGQILLSLLDANVHINWCTFSSTGLFIIGNRMCNVEGLARENSESEDEDSESEDEYLRIEDFEWDYTYTYDQQDSFCVWNAITWQRSDERNLADELGQSQSRKCKRCFQLGYKGQKLKIELCAMSPRKKWFVGMYDGAKCIFVLNDHSLKVRGGNFFSNIYEYDRFMKIAATVDDLLFSANWEKFTVFKKFPATEEQTFCFPHLTLVLWSSFSPDGSRLATCVSGGCIKIWDVYTSQVEQHFQHNRDESLCACWWSEKFLLVFRLFDGAPSLSRFPVCNLKILFSQNQQISLFHLLNDFKPISAILDFSENLLSFECGETEPVKVLDVNKGERPQMITLPRIRPMMNIAVSPGASYIFGGGRDKYFIWKRNASKEPGVYDLMEEEYSLEGYDDFFVPYHKPNYTCCFTNDSRVAVVADRNESNLRCDIIDLITGNCQRKSFGDTSRWLEILPFRSQLFCVKNNMLIVASEFAIRFFDMDSGVRLACSFQPYLTWDLRKQTKVSPKENVMAFPKVNGDMVFVRLCIPSEPLLSDIKREAVFQQRDNSSLLLIEVKRRFVVKGVPQRLTDVQGTKLQ